MVSERGDFRLAVEGLRVPGDWLSYNLWRAPYLVLTGTRVCPHLSCSVCPDGDNCHDATLVAEGPVVADEESCFVAEAPGDVVWTVDGPCGEEGQPPDRIVMRVLTPDQVEARVSHVIDAMVARYSALDQPTITTIGAPWIDLLPHDLKVVAGEDVRLEVGLHELGSGHAVARQAEPAAEVVWTPTRGRPAVTYPGEGFELVTFAGSEADASFRFGDLTWPIGHVTGVPAESATSLELAGAVYIMEDPDAPLLGRTAVPMAARAIARDDAGDLVVGLPMAWSAEVGNMAYFPEYTEFEHMLLSDDCIPSEERDGPRRLVLRGRHGDLSATLEYTWAGTSELTPFNFVDPGDSWAPPATCLAPAGCGCRSADPGGGALLLLGLLALGRRRRGKSHVSKSMSVGACLLALPTVGCGDPPTLQADEVLPLGALPLSLHTEQGGHSVAVGDRALWMFRTASDDEGLYAASAAAVLPDFDARDGLWPFEPYETPAENDFDEPLPFLDREASYKYDYDDGECILADTCPRVSLWPGPMVHDPQRDRVLIFYRKVIQFPASADNLHVGSSIAVWRDDLAGGPVRPTVAEGSAEPSLLFAADGPVFAAALREEEHVHAFACDGKQSACRLLRAPLARALERDAWRFFAAGEWSSSERAADELFDGAGAMSVHWSAHAGAYVAVYADREEPVVVMRTAPRLTGPWSDAAELYRPPALQDPPLIRDALLHPELARDAGAVDYLTYFAGAVGSSSGSGTQELVEIHWQ